SQGVNWDEESIREWVKVDRFGLNLDFIEEHDIPRIDNLMTASGKSLADPTHKDHKKEYVQSYLATFGEWKVEANALVVRPESGRQLCLDAILKFLPEDAGSRFTEALWPHREELREAIAERFGLE